MMPLIKRILVLDGSAATGDGPCRAALLMNANIIETLADRSLSGRGSAERLPRLCQTLWEQYGWQPQSTDLIVVISGPGSFTGLRASIALAQGLAIGCECPAVAVTNGEALSSHLRKKYPDRIALALTIARRNRIFVENMSSPSVFASTLDQPLSIEGKVVLTGNAAYLVYEQRNQLLHETNDVLLADVFSPSANMIAQTGLDRLFGRLPSRPLLPMYVDPPATSLPKIGCRPLPTV